MTRFHLVLSVLLSGFMVLFTSVSVYAADETTTTTTTTQSPEGTVVKEVKTTRIVTPVPAAKEIVTAPQGFATCFKVAEGWFNDIWVPAHQVCQYDNSAEGTVWVEGYWGCNKATADGVCTNWEWKAGRWEKKLVVY